MNSSEVGSADVLPVITKIVAIRKLDAQVVIGLVVLNDAINAKLPLVNNMYVNPCGEPH